MEENTIPPLERRCPACGAAMLQGARFCGACGMESLPADVSADVSTVAASADVEQPASALPDAPSAPAPAAAPAPPAATPATATVGAGQADDAEGRICPWCDAVNPLDAVRCVACDAVFPTPEGDEALERAAQARIRSMESELKQPRAGWWPFRAR